MSKIKNALFTTAITLVTFGTITYTSCSKDECKDVVCNNGGTCVSGNCSCPAGYEGSNCQTLTTAKFIKSWTAPNDQNISTGKSIGPYTCIIAPGNSLNTLIIGNTFSNSFFVHSIDATVSGSGTTSTITVPLQYPDGAANFSVQGSATYNSDGTLSWNYTIASTAAGSKSYSGTWN